MALTGAGGADEASSGSTVDDTSAIEAMDVDRLIDRALQIGGATQGEDVP
jgi:hypothetical protein